MRVPENVKTFTCEAQTCFLKHLHIRVSNSTFIISGVVVFQRGAIFRKVAFGLQSVNEINPFGPGVSRNWRRIINTSIRIERQCGGTVSLEPQGGRYAGIVELKLGSSREAAGTTEN